MPPTIAQLEAFVSSPVYDAQTAGLIASLIPALKAGEPGELISPGVRRIRGNLCNVHGRYGPCDKALSGKKPKKSARGRKPPAPKKTDAQRATERDQQRAQNAASVAQQMADNDTGIAPAGAKALLAFAKGTPPDAATGASLAKMGLAEQASDGSYRMTPTGRAVVSAMQAGDYQRAVDGISRATDQAGKRAERQAETAQRRQDAAGKRAAAQLDRELRKRKPKPAKASAGGSKKPAAHAEPAPERPRSAPKPKPKRASRTQAPKIGGGSSGGGSSKPKPPEKAPAKQLDPKLTEAATALSEGAEITDEQLQGLITNGLVKLDKNGEPVLTAAGRRATMKEVRHGLETATRRTPAQRAGVGAGVRKGLRARHNRPQSAYADRQAGRTTRQGAAETKLKAPAHTGVMIALYPDPAAAKQIAAQDGVTEPVDTLHLTLAFMGDSTETALATNKEKVIAAVKQWAIERGKPLEGTVNGLGRFFHSEDDDTNVVYVSPDVPGLPELRQSLVEWIEQSGFDYAQNHGFTPHITVAYVPLDASTPPIRIETPIAFKQVTLAWGDERYDYPLGVTAQKSMDGALLVFKDARGAWRWVAQSSTAYQDRDREIVSTEALTDDCERADADGSYGPLRWWHTPGLDLGDCDFNAMHGRVLIESGTFRSPAIAQKVARAAADLEISLGFLHLPTEPDADGVFHHIRRFERSLVPRGKASNRFTAFTVKESRRMDATKIAALKTLGFSDEDITALQAQAAATEKAATDQGVAFKADEPELPDIIVNGVTYKAFKPPVEDVAEAEATEETMVETDAIDDMPVEEVPDDPNALTLSAGDIAAIQELIVNAVGQIMGGLDLEKKVAGHVQGLLQPYQQAQTTKDAEAAATREQLGQLQQQLKELQGDQPAVPYRASAAKDTLIGDAKLLEAVKSQQPAAGPFDDIIQGLGLIRPQ